MDSHIIRFTHTAELPTPDSTEALVTGMDYVIGVTTAITNIDRKDNQDGTFTFTYKARVATVDLVNAVGKSIQARAKGSESKRQRGQLFVIHRDYNIEEDFETWYPKAMASQMRHTEENLSADNLLQS